MRQQFIDICTKITQITLPQQCLLCAASCHAVLCDGCSSDLPFHSDVCCPVCGIHTPQAETCGSCLKHQPHFDTTRAAFAYAFPMDALLRALKYQGKLIIAELVGQHLAQRVAGMQADIIIPMPLHSRRLHERGFNQAIEIARALSRHTGIPYATDGAARLRDTAPQASLPLAARAKNMRNAFTCGVGVEGKRVAVVDDVMTSGASLDELAKTLKAAGAVSVACWVAARTLRD